MHDHEGDPRTTPAPAPDIPTRPWCLFQCGHVGYAVGLDAVAEVVEVERLVRLPFSPPRLLGLCVLRREVVPVIGLGGDGPGAADPAPPPDSLLVLILRTARGIWAVRIDPEGTAVTEEPLDGAAAPVGAPPGTVRRGDVSYTVLDPEATWQDVRQSVETWYCDRNGRDTAPGPHPGRAEAPAD